MLPCSRISEERWPCGTGVASAWFNVACHPFSEVLFGNEWAISSLSYDSHCQEKTKIGSVCR